jgi:hypothetical protein
LATPSRAEVGATFSLESPCLIVHCIENVTWVWEEVVHDMLFAIV